MKIKELMECAIDCLITYIKIASQKFVVRAVFPKNALFGNKCALLWNGTVSVALGDVICDEKLVFVQ